MNIPLFAELRRYTDRSAVTVVESADEMQLRIERCGFIVSILIPSAALEFRVTVDDTAGVRLIEDRLDYAGYDAGPEAELVQEMHAEVLRFSGRLLLRDLRYVRASRCLEWLAGDRWLQAVPVVPDTDQSFLTTQPRRRGNA